MPLTPDRTTWPEGVHETLEAIALGVGRRVLETPDTIRDPAGCALFLTVATEQLGHQENSAAAAIDLTLAYFNRDRPSPSLFGGIWGAGITLATLVRWGWPVSFDFDALDQAALECLRCVPWRGKFELIAGLAGLGLYGVERAVDVGRTDIVDGVVEALISCSERHGESVTWYSRPALARSLQTSFPKGVYDLGMAHGVSGVVAFLARAATCGATHDRTTVLLRETLTWLTGQSFPLQGSGGVSYPAFVDPENGGGRLSRLAWCYGDLGVSLALADAAEVLGDQAQMDAAKQLGRACASRAWSNAGVVDTTLCHGSQGAAHLFWRWYERTGERGFAEAAVQWTKTTLDYRHSQRHAWEDGGIPGVTYRLTRDDRIEWLSDETLLEGGSGVGLALLTLVGKDVPAWDMQFGTNPIRG